MSVCDELCQNADPPLPRTILEVYLQRQQLIFKIHAKIFWKKGVLKNFADLKMSKYLRSLENYLQKSLLLVKLLLLLNEE